MKIFRCQKIIMEVCKPIKFLAGLSFDEFKENTPKDLVGERLQIARYPPTGFIEPHIDANTVEISNFWLLS